MEAALEDEEYTTMQDGESEEVDDCATKMVASSPDDAPNVMETIAAAMTEDNIDAGDDVDDDDEDGGGAAHVDDGIDDDDMVDEDEEENEQQPVVVEMDTPHREAASVDDQSSQATDETADTGDALQTSPHTPPLDDFLAIVPKPTLLSKEKAKKRLRAFNMSKLGEYYINKKKAAAEAAAAAAEAAAAAASAEAAAIKKPSEQATTLDAKRKQVKAERNQSSDGVHSISQQDVMQQVQSKGSRTSVSNSRRTGVDDRHRHRECRRRDQRKRTRTRSPSSGGHGNAADRKRGRHTINTSRSRAPSYERSTRNIRSDDHHPHVREGLHSKSVVAYAKDNRSKRRTRSPSGGDTCANHHDDKHQHQQQPPAELSDIRKMLLFNSVRYSFKPFHYKKLDGSLADLSIQYLRYTSTSTPRIAYSPNPGRTKGTYFQRDELLSVVGKHQKDALAALIAQAAQGQPISPSKSSSTTMVTSRSWYPKEALAERLADESLYYDDAELERYAQKVSSSACLERQSKSKKAKTAKQREAKHKRHKKAKKKRRTLKEEKTEEGEGPVSPRAKSPVARVGVDGSNATTLLTVATGMATATSKPRQRTDTHKSDSNSIHSNDRLSHSNRNHVNSDEVHLSEKKPPKTPPPPSSMSRNKAEKSSSRRIYSRRSSDNDKSDCPRLKHEQLTPLKSVNSLREDLRDELSVLSCKSVLAELSKTMPIPAALLATPTKIYKIKTDCIDKLDFTPAVRHVIKIASEPKQEPPIVITTKCKKDENEDERENKLDDVTTSTVMLNHLLVKEPTAAPAASAVPIEKLKSKPSELYSPTLQSLSSESSTSDVEMPDNEEWILDAQSSMGEEEEDVGEEEEGAGDHLDSSWESEEECYVMVHRQPTMKRKGLEERSLEMPLNINISRSRSQVILPREMPDIKTPSLFDDLEAGTCWDADLRHNVFDLETSVHSPAPAQAPATKRYLEHEYMQFMSSVSTIEEKTSGKRRYSTTSTESSSESSSSSSDSGSSLDDNTSDHIGELCTTSEVLPAVVTAHSTPQPTTIPQTPIQTSPVCTADSTSSPAITTNEKESKLQFPIRKSLPAIVLAKKNPLVGCSLFRDEDSDNETIQATNQTASSAKQVERLGEEKAVESESRRQSPCPKRNDTSPQPPTNHKVMVSPLRRDAITVRHYSASRHRRTSPIRRDDDSPKRMDRHGDGGRRSSPRQGRLSPRRISPRASPKRGESPRRGGVSPRRFPSPRSGSPKHSRDNSPRYKERRGESEKTYTQDGGRRREGSPRHRGNITRRRSRSPKHDHHHHHHRSPPPLLSRHRDHYDVRNRDDRCYRDQKYRDGSPRHRESPSRFSPSRRRSPPRHRYSPKRDSSPRYRGRSPRRRSLSPNRRIYSRSSSKERKHETITQALHRLAGMEYEPPKSSPRPVDSPMDGYIRGVPDSTISDEQLLQNRGGGDFNATQSPVFFNATYKHPDGGVGGGGSGGGGGGACSPKRIPLDDRINQVLGIDAGKENSDYTSEPYYNQQMYYDQYGGNIQQTNHYEHYNNTVNTLPTKVLQVGNVLQVVPTEHLPPLPLKSKTTDAVVTLPEPTTLLSEIPKKFVPVGNMLEIVPTTELPKSEEAASTPEAPEAGIAVKLAEDLLKLRTVERKTEREKRRQERDRRRKEKELKRADREQRKQVKLKLKSEAMIKKALMYDGIEDSRAEDTPKSTSVTITSSGAKMLKGILTRKSNETDVEAPVSKKKGVKFADGVLPGEGTSPSGGEELSSPPPFSKVPKEKRYTKTKRPKTPHKKKIKVKIVRTKAKKTFSAADDNLPPPSPPPGSPPIHLFPPRVKASLINPASFYANYPPFNTLAFPPETGAHPPFTTMPPTMPPSIPPNIPPNMPPTMPPNMTPSIPTTIPPNIAPNMQYAPISHLHLPPGQPPPPPPQQQMHPISLLLPPPPNRLVAKPPPPPPLGKPIEKTSI